MKKENLNTLYNEVEKAYGFINDFLGNHGLDMIDLAYPNHDGVQDADVAADMMLLRQSTNSLSKACNILVKKLTDAIGDENELVMYEIKNVIHDYLFVTLCLRDVRTGVTRDWRYWDDLEEWLCEEYGVKDLKGLVINKLPDYGDWVELRK